MLLVDDFLTFQVNCSFVVMKIADSFELTKTLKKHAEYYGKANNNELNSFFVNRNSVFTKNIFRAAWRDKEYQNYQSELVGVVC